MDSSRNHFFGDLHYLNFVCGLNIRPIFPLKVSKKRYSSKVCIKIIDGTFKIWLPQFYKVFGFIILYIDALGASNQLFSIAAKDGAESALHMLFSAPSFGRY